MKILCVRCMVTEVELPVKYCSDECRFRRCVGCGVLVKISGRKVCAECRAIWNYKKPVGEFALSEEIMQYEKRVAANAVKRYTG